MDQLLYTPLPTTGTVSMCAKKAIIDQQAVFENILLLEMRSDLELAPCRSSYEVYWTFRLSIYFYLVSDHKIPWFVAILIPSSTSVFSSCQDLPCCVLKEAVGYTCEPVGKVGPFSTLVGIDEDLEHLPLCDEHEVDLPVRGVLA